MSNTITNSRYQKTFLIDIYSSYSVTPGIPLQLTNVDVVSDMIANVIQTSPGERPFQPLFGSGVPQLLFNNLTASNANLILQNIFYSVQRFVPFVTINTQTSEVYADLINGIYYFVLYYAIEGLPGTITTTLSLAANQ